MASFLDKLLGPNVLRDIGAMGVRGERNIEASEYVLEEAREWYENADRSYGYMQESTDWDNLSQSSKDRIVNIFLGQEEAPSVEDDAQFYRDLGFPTHGRDLRRTEVFANKLGDASSSIVIPSQYSSPESFGGIGFNPLSASSILENAPGEVGERYREGAEGALSPDVVKPLTMDQIRKTTTGFYNPFIEKEKKPLVDRLIEKRTTAAGLGGDFSGYGQREKYADIAEGSFMSGVENIYSDVDQYRASATDDLYSTIRGWEDLEGWG